MPHPCWLLVLVTFLAPIAVSAAEPLHQVVPPAVAPPAMRGVAYCQTPDYGMIYQMSSGFDAEFADDIPVEWIGSQISAVTLWLGEWYSVGGPTWTDPLGIRLNFYHASCPLELDGYRSIEVAWELLEKSLVHSTGGSDVYEIIVPVDPPVTVGEAMSLGATALIDWGHNEPFTGLCATPFGVAYGACSAYLDGAWWGYQRWTAIDFFTGIPQDLGYCLTTTATSVPAPPAANIGLHVHPNPSAGYTQIRFSMGAASRAQLSVYDVAGREVVDLVNGSFSSGSHSIGWDGRDHSGAHVGPGVYFVRFQADGEVRTRRVVRARN